MKYRMTLGLIILLHSSLILAIPIFYKGLIDTIIHDKSLMKALMFAGGILFSAVVSSALEHLGNYFKMKLSLETAKAGIISNMEKFYCVDFQRAREDGKYLNLIFNTSMDMASKEVELFHKLLNSVFGGIFMVMIGTYLSPEMFILSIAIFLSSFSLVNYISRYVNLAKSREIDEGLKFKNHLINTLRSFKLWRLIRLKKFYVTSAFEKFKSRYIKFEIIVSIVSNVSWFLYQGVYVAIILVGGYMVLQKILSISSLLATVYLVRRYGDIFSDITSLIPLYREIQAYKNRLYKDLTPIQEYRIFKEYIKCQDIYVSYGEKVVLKNLHFEAKNSDKILIIGPNGSGKTTLAHIISGNLKPLKGKVITPRKVSSLIQPVHLPPVKVKDIVSSENLKRCGLDDLKENLCTELSMGQKQIIGTILTLSKESDAYIFDEPLENLDEAMTKKISEIILTDTSNKILIIIQHTGNAPFMKFKEVKIA